MQLCRFPHSMGAACNRGPVVPRHCPCGMCVHCAWNPEDLREPALWLSDWDGFDGELPDTCAMIGRVAPDIPTARPLRTHAELAQLVAAIVKASPTGETDWLEWKRTLDLSSKIAQGVIARTILGMANRTVATAISSARVQGCPAR